MKKAEPPLSLPISQIELTRLPQVHPFESDQAQHAGAKEPGSAGDGGFRGGYLGKVEVALSEVYVQRKCYRLTGRYLVGGPKLQLVISSIKRRICKNGVGPAREGNSRTQDKMIV